MAFLDFFRPKKAKQPTPAKKPAENLIQRIKRFFTPAKKPKTETTPAPPPASHPTQKQRAQMRANAEQEAMRKATNILLESLNHPDDAGWQEARRRAKEYIDKSTNLAGKGPLQDKNRQRIAERYVEDILSTPEGVDERKEARRAQFNANMGSNFSGDQWDTVEKILNSKSFKKLHELFSSYKPSEIITMITDPLSSGATVANVERSVDLFSREQIPPEMDLFNMAVNLNDTQFERAAEDIAFWNRETDTSQMDEHEIGEYMFSMFERVRQDETLQRD